MTVETCIDTCVSARYIRPDSLLNLWCGNVVKPGSDIISNELLNGVHYVRSQAFEGVDDGRDWSSIALSFLPQAGYPKNAVYMSGSEGK